MLLDCFYARTILQWPFGPVTNDGHGCGISMIDRVVLVSSNFLDSWLIFDSTRSSFNSQATSSSLSRPKWSNVLQLDAVIYCAAHRRDT